MANKSVDWSQCPAVESIPGKVGGAWVFRGTRVPVSAVFENLKTSPLEEVLANFHVTREQVQCVLDFASRTTQPLEHLRADEIILDESVPQKLRLSIEGHKVLTVAFQGWSGLKNGAPLMAAEETGYELFITADREIGYQQNLAGRKMARWC